MSASVPFVDFRARVAQLRPELDAALARVLDSGWFVLGPEGEAFERELAQALGAREAVAVANGTDALHLALRARGIGPGDEVITTSISAAFSALAILHAGARPVFVDVDPLTLNIDPKAAERAITNKTRALMPVHLYGHPADMDPLLELARSRGLVVLEDACQAHGALYNGRPVGTLAGASGLARVWREPWSDPSSMARRGPGRRCDPSSFFPATFSPPPPKFAVSSLLVRVVRLRRRAGLAKKALITGITGQDGSYLAELLLEKGYEVHGLVRRSSSFNTWRIDHVRDRLVLHYGDLVDQNSLARALEALEPDEVYNLAAQSHVKVSFEMPEYTTDVTAIGVLRLLDAVRDLGLKARVYQAGSSEMFGLVQETPQTEKTPFHPRSPYAVSKVYGHYMAVNYRESYGMHVSNGILFNHESPRRGENFVTRKITMGVAAIKQGRAKELRLGNLDAKRDWGHARDYVEAMWRILQQEKPSDYVIATGETHSVREFCEEAFGAVGLDWKDFVKVDAKYFRPAEVDLLLGDASKARRELGWAPKVTFKELARLMVEADLESAGKHPERPR